MAAEVESFGRQNALAADSVFQLNLVLEELFTNAVRHGGCEGIAGAVRVTLQAHPAEIAIEYVDRGIPFDPAEAASPDLSAPLAARPAGGLGIYFVRQLAGKLEYRREAGLNKLTFRLEREPRP